MPAPRPHPLLALFTAPVLVAVVLSSQALAAMLSLARPLDADWPIRFGLTSLAVLWIVLVLLGAVRLARPLLLRLPPQAWSWAMLALLVVVASSVAWAGWQLAGGPMAAESPLRFLVRVVALAAIAGLLALLIYQNYWRALQSSARADAAELELLRARLHPHFLFNTLNTGAALVHDRPEEAERLLLDLADLFRAAFSGPGVIPLSEELALVRRYLEIESLRFGSRLEVRWTLPDAMAAVAATPVPALAIQPLVENAIKHGVEPRLEGGTVEIEVSVQPGQVTIRIGNPLAAQAPAASSGHGIGLEAVRARLTALAPGAALVTRAEADGFSATVTLPTGA
ncbi:histidine kinase [Luteimonas sp. RC10]|uniref:sensor histidine kinase n=1 Tax=Luteimonas sp. RC10 TaxID=2587035 RepID=UPI00160CC657|nr:histidine kinase [Luteimonas sp. RC10]MBB3343716.1 two-component system sensor histidine kinase AlgZ [Luteimonas sp. RC10]